MKTGRKRFDWTEERVELLRANYPNKKTGVVAKMIGTSERTVVRKATELGLQKESVDEIHQQYQDVIKAKFYTHSCTEIADGLNISKWTVRRIARGMGLHRNKEEDHVVRSQARHHFLDKVKYWNAIGVEEQMTEVKLLPKFSKEGAERHRSRINLRCKLRNNGYVIDWDSHEIYYPEGMKRHPIQERHGAALGLSFSPL